MSNIVRRAGLLASAVLLCVCSPASAAPEDTIKELQQQIDSLKQQQGKYTVGNGSLAIESWLLTSTALDSTADVIKTRVATAMTGDANRALDARIKHIAALKQIAQQTGDPDPSETTARKILVITGAEPLDFSQVVMMDTEIHALTERLAAVCGCVTSSSTTGQHPFGGILLPAIGAAASILRSDTELTAVEQTVDAKLLAAAVAGKLNAILPSSAIASGGSSRLIVAFKKLVDTADEAQVEYDKLSGNPKATDPEKEKAAKLKVLLARYDAFYARVTTAKDGIVPLAYAARLQDLMDGDPYVLRVNTEKAGGTLVKRTNVLTAFGAPSAFITAGLVSSYQLTDPVTGELIAAGIVTCRTTLTSLKRVQDESWQSFEGRRRMGAKALCSPH
jgi:hypothetical protein